MVAPMARLMALALEWHPRMGACFVIRFSWNARVENPIERVKSIPASDREYDPDHRRWWIAARHVTFLASLFENWQEESALLAGSQPDTYSAVMEGVLRQRVLEAVDGVLDASPAISGDAILTALGEAIACWLEEWRQAAPDAVASLTSARLAEVRASASRIRRDLPGWVLRAAFAGELLAPGALLSREDGYPPSEGYDPS